MTAKQLSAQQASDIIWVCRRLAGALQSGMTIVPALDSVGRHAPARARAPLRAMRESAACGRGMAQGLAQLGWPSFVRSAIWYGEVSASLERVLPRIADRLEAEQGMPIPGDQRLHAYSLALGRMGMMLDVGVPLVTALQAVAESAGHSEVREVVSAAREAVLEGTDLGDALEHLAPDLPPMTMEMIRDGEREQRLDEVLPVVADYLLDEAGQKSARRQKREVRNA